MQSIKNERFLQGIINCYKYEGISGFYKGMSLPFYTISFINAASLVGNEFSKKIIKVHEDRDLTILQSFICGYMAGMCTSIIATPVEIVKCRLQIQKESLSKSYYKGVWDILLKEYKYHGIKGLYHGNVSCYNRETFGYSGQFGSYQYLKLKLTEYRKVDYDSISNFDIILAGSIAGLIGWIVSYPFDMVKTIIQTGTKVDLSKIEASKNSSLEIKKINSILEIDDIILKRDNKIFYNYKPIMYDGGMMNCLRIIYKNSGVKGLFTGFLPCGISGFYGYGIMFIVYEHSKDLLEKTIFIKENPKI